MKIALTLSISTLILAGCAQTEDRDSMGASGPITSTERSTGQSTTSYLSEQDQTFIKETAQGGMMEVKMGRLGAQKGHSEAVRQLGQKLVQDHSKANQELKLLASQKNITLPTETPSEHQAMLSHLQSLEGAEFDKAFKKHAVEDHQKDIQKFQTALQSPDADLKAFAQKTLPVLQQHLEMAQKIEAQGTEQTTETVPPPQTETVPPQQP